MTVLVRPATRDDHEPAITVWVASEAARRGGPAPAEVPDGLRDRFRRPDVWLLVADDGGEVVGVTQGWPARDDDGAGPVIAGRCHLSLVFVAPGRWGEGIGGRLLDSALDHARALGNDRVQLYTHEDNTRAHRLYTGRGFVRDGVTRDDAWGDRIGRWSRAL